MALTFFPFLIIYFGYSNCIEKYDDRPRIYVSNGDLKIIAPPSKNIDFVARGTSVVSINNINVLKTLMKADNATKLTERYQHMLVSYNDRLEALEGRIIDSPLPLGTNVSTTSDSFTVHKVYILSVKVNRLFRMVRNITATLLKDECLSNPCKNGGTCQDMYSRYLCNCAPGWEGPDCSVDVNECSRIQGTDLGCQNGGVCRNTIGSYACDCVNGFVGLHCSRKSVDCLTAGSELCGHGTCVAQGNEKGYKCLCDAGWTVESPGLACTKDVNECQQNHPSCAAGVLCLNVPGSFYCGSCPPGFTGNGYHCTDINECDTNNGGCSLNPLVLCINTHGSRVCAPCPAGYAGDGTTCSFQGVCNVNNGGCHPMATCTESSVIGTQCTCPLGYIGTGIGPSGCIRSDIQHPCLPNPCLNGVCSVNSSSASYQCQCFRHYRGKNCDILAGDSCTPNPCMHNGECLNVNNKLICKCKAGYTGKFCSTQLQGCGGVLKSNNGTLKYPNDEFAYYNHQSNCVWSILLNDTNKVIFINITKFDIEESPSCRKEWLEIHDGGNTAAPTIGRFCGKKKPLNGTFTSTHDRLYFWFRSTSRSSAAGFELTWKTQAPICDKLLIQQSHGSIQSPGAPGNYPLNRNCHWRLFAALDKRYMFHFFSLNIGNNADCNADYIKFYSSLYPMEESLFAKFCNSSSPEPFYSPGSRVTISFHSDNKDTYPGFQLTYSEVEGVPGCGGTFTKSEGIISSAHSESDDLSICEYKIHQTADRKIKINFIKFDLSGPGGCTFNYVEIHEGNSEDSPSVGRHCGSKIPAPYISQGNQLTIMSSSSGSTSNKGWKLEYISVCGSKYTDQTGSFNSSTTGRDSLNCIYQIERPPGNIIMLIMKINLPQTSYYLRIRRTLNSPHFMRPSYRMRYPYHSPEHIVTDCVSRYVEVRDGDHENATLLGKYCGIGTVNITSTHNFLWIGVNDRSLRSRYSTEVPVTFKYTSMDVGCGGILRNKIGNIASPTHPDGSYPSDLNCKWTIIAPAEDVIKLTWMTFYIEESNECTYDNVQVFDNNTDLGEGALMGKFCGFNLPPTLLSSSNMMTIMFKTDVTVSMDGFLASYVTIPEKDVCGGSYFTPSGVIKSPKYPESYPTNRQCTWTIHVPPGQQIMLNVTEFNIESYSGCRYDWLEIRNGGTSASPLIGKYCGTTIPKQITSHANKFYIFFKSDLSKSGPGFRITWSSAATGCGGILTSPTGSLISPHYPEPYSKNTECLWKIITSAGSRLQVVFSDINLERHIQCSSDYVQIFDGLTINSNSLGKYCLEAPDPVKSTANEMLVKFRSDVTFQGRGFQLHYSTVCRNTVKGFRGVIESPNFPNDYPENQDCSWDIEVSDRNKINITFSHFELERSSTFANNSCQYDYVEISYAETPGDYEETRTYTKYGKYCGQQSPGHISLNSDRARIRFVSDKLLLGSGFRLEWEIFGCGGILKKKSGTITSPNYPLPYPMSSVCEWRIEVDFGQSILLEFHDVDIEKDTVCDFDSVSVYNGIDETYNLLSKICRQNKNTIISSTGNYMFVKFKSDPSYQGKGFTANYSTIPTTCGGRMTAVEGFIYSPNYPKNYNKNETCEWFIDVDEGHSVELKFEDVDLFQSTNCLQNYIKIHDGPSAAFPVLKTVCGTDTPNDTIRSTYNNVFIEFKTHALFTSKGFKLQYHKSCGSRITTQSRGVISINQDDFSEALQDCHWIIAATDPSKHVSLTISRISAMYYCEESDATVKIYNGQSSDSPLIGQYCGPKVPPTIVSDGSALSINITSQTDFFASYTVLDSQCGGTLMSAEGYFATPGYPKKYASSMECEWTIQISPGNHVSLSFIEFDLLDSENCNSDYLEIRSNNASGKLLGVFCGSNEPENISHVGSLWMLYKGSKPEKGDTEITAKGFYGEYNLNTFNELNGTRGEIWSPLYPSTVIDYKMYSWKITVATKKRILLSFNEFYLDAMNSLDDECYFATFEVFDGVDDTAESLGKYCGLTLPAPIKSTSNIMLIQVDYNSPRLGSKFKVTWEEVDGATTSVLPASQIINTNCSNDNKTDINIHALHNYTLMSPGYPEGYAANLKCEWTFSTISMNHLILYFFNIDFNIFSNRYTINRNCELNDKVNIYEKHFFDNEWKKVKTVCKNSDAENFVHTTDLMKIEFVTTKFINGTGFKARIIEACGGWLRESTGYIIFDNSSLRGTECQWNITVKSTKTIEITFEEMNIEFDSNKGCNNYLMLRNGKFADSPLLGAGKYCGTTLPAKQRSTGNNLYIKYKGTTITQSFRLKYQEVSAECGGRIVLSKYGNFTEISSPNYPNIPTSHIECQWIITAPPGDILRIDFEDRFDLTFKQSCDVEYVELRDGGTEHSNLIGRYCKSSPSSQFTTDHMLFIKFFTDTDDPKNGFKAKISLDRCGGTIRGSSGEISYNHPGDAKINCTWHIVGPIDHFLSINFTKIELTRSHLKKNYVSIEQRREVSQETQNSTLGKFYGTHLPNPIVSDNNEVIIRLVVTDGPGKFFLKYKASQSACGGDMRGDTGTLESPGYPVMNHFNRYCNWKIEVPEGRRVTLKFIDIDLGPNILRYERAIAIYDATDLRQVNRAISIITSMSGNSTFESSSNKMSVVFWCATRSEHRGFKAVYTSIAPTICEGDFSRENGIIKTPSARNSMYHCEWSHIRSDIDRYRTFAISVILSTNASKTISNSPISTTCSYSSFYVKVTSTKNDETLGKLCLNTGNPVVIRSPFFNTKLEVLASLTYIMNFTATYSTHDCGGIIHDQSGVISSPNYPNKPTKAYECAWLLKVLEGQVLNISSINIHLGDDCEKSHLVIYNGELPTYPKIGKYCKQSKPEMFISQSNNLWIEYKHDSSSNGVGFQFKYEAISSGCGGIFHDKSRNIHSPNFGSGDYPNNAECLWIIQSEHGYHIRLNFVGRFHLEQSNNCSNDFIEVWHWDDEKWISLGRKCGREIPTALESKTDKMKILFRSNDRIGGGGFKATWEWLCGGKFIADRKSRYIISPGYPSPYQKNLKCEYTITTLTPAREAVNIKFLDFQLEQGSPECKYDNLTIQGQNVLGSYVYSKNVYCGDKVPPAVRMRGIITITFQTDQWLNKRGFKLEYEDDSCGGEITEETIINKELNNFSGNTGYGGLRYYQPKVRCVWNITAPQNQIAILSIVKMDMFLTPRCFGENLEVFNQLDTNRNNRLAILCGNLEDSYQIHSETGKMLVKLEAMPNRFGGFKAVVRFSHGPAQGCGGFINLTDVKTIRSPNLAKLNCGWNIVAPRDYQIVITVNKLDILTDCGQGNKTNSSCECMFLEIRDGSSPFAERMDKFCTPITIPTVRRTSANTAYVNLFIRGQKNNALDITLRPVMSVCGPSVLIATKVKKELLSPNYLGHSYPSFLSCSYIIAGGSRFDKIALHFVEFDLTDEISDSPDSSGNKCPGDYLQIYENPNSNTVNGLGSDVIYNGLTKHGSLLYTDPRGRHIFCGQDDKPFDYYSTGNVTISFVTKGKLPKGRGFKIEYAIAGCNRNYSEEHGRISNGNSNDVGNNSECNFWIMVPENRTISIYFSLFYTYFSRNCTLSYVEVRDASPTGTVLAKVCGYRVPYPIFSLTNKLYFKTVNRVLSIRYDLLFTSTDQGRGCGGNIYNNKGKIFSPMYPNPFRNDTTCTWRIRVPSSLHLVLKFTMFDIQGKCEQTNLKIETTTDLNVNSVELCSTYQPGVVYRSDSYINIRYTSSIHNGGTGWIASFQAVSKEVTEII